ncbi:MAG TPA: alcohol dehydrogenase catalytic domain-containing protein [Actinomycetota bacterium]
MIRSFGGTDAVEVVDLPDPEPGPGEVVVAVRAAALNHLDLWTVSGAIAEPKLPHVLGADGAGEIVALGDGVTGVRRGDRVIVNPAISCGRCERCRAGEQSECTTFRMIGEHLPGTFAQRIAVPAENVFPFPDHLSFENAAALGVTFITAYRMLFARGGLRPAEWVLITGIGGGLALSLLQLCRPVAGRVIVTSSSQAKIERARELGADEGIDYKQEDVGKAVRRLTGKRGVDLVVDSAGGPTLDASIRSLRAGGRVVISGATAGGTSEINVRRLFWSQLSVIGSTMGSVADVSDMLRAVAGAKLEPIVDRTFALDDVQKALQYLESGDHFGKVVLQIPPVQ